MKLSRSPSALSVELLVGRGYAVNVVERRLTARISSDLFGCIDILALRGAETLAVQTSTRHHLADRSRKVADSEYLPAMREAGWTIHIHGWDEPTRGEFRVKTLDVS